MSKWLTRILSVVALFVIGVIEFQHFRSAAEETNGQMVLDWSPPLPEYLVETEDVLANTNFTRITKPGKLAPKMVCGKDYCTHRYSSSQAWNADQTLLVIANGCGGFCFLDGQTYQPLFYRNQAGECEWNPADANQMICVGPETIRIWEPRSDETELVFEPEEYTGLQFGPGKGNPSLAGDRIVVRASLRGKPVAFLFDLATRTKHADIELSSLPGENSYCTIAPRGTRVLCFQNVTGGEQWTYIFDADGKPLMNWQENHRPGHGDLTVDSDGSEIIVGISKSAPDKYQVIKRRLDDGAVTALSAYGVATHVSLRATSSSGWAIVSFEGNPQEVIGHPKWTQHGRQIVALALDGSGTARVVANTHNRKADYDSETHASVSPDGTQVIWSSNWNNPGGPVYDFVTRVPPSLVNRDN